MAGTEGAGWPEALRKACREARSRRACDHSGVNVMALAFQLAVGLAAGLAIGFLLGRARVSSGASDIVTRLAEAEARAKVAEEKAAYVEGQLTERFQALSAKALDVNNLRFLELAETRMAVGQAEAAGELEQRKQAVEHLIEPLKDTLARVETQLRDTQAGQRVAHAELAKHIDVVRESNDQLRLQTTALVRALQRPEARGRWGVSCSTISRRRSIGSSSTGTSARRCTICSGRGRCSHANAVRRMSWRSMTCCKAAMKTSSRSRDDSDRRMGRTYVSPP